MDGPLLEFSYYSEHLWIWKADNIQGRHGRFLAGKAAIVVATLPAPLSNSQNLAKEQALAALPTVGGGPAIREPINKTSHSSHRIQLWMWW